MDGDTVLLEVVSENTVTAVAPRILVQALPKGRHMDTIVEKATELGATRIVPVHCSRSVVRISGQHADARVARWQRIAEGAAKQCGTPWTPVVDPVTDFGAAVARVCSSVSMSLIGTLSGSSLLLREVLQERWDGEGVALFVGPEGDFTPEEVALSERAGVVPVHFGTRVLRVETASLFGLSVLAYASVPLQ